MTAANAEDFTVHTAHVVVSVPGSPRSICKELAPCQQRNNPASWPLQATGCSVEAAHSPALQGSPAAGAPP